MKKFKIVVIAHGKTITAISDGTESGTTINAEERDLNAIKYAIRRGSHVDLTHSRERDEIRAGYDSPLALTAALCSLDEMRSVIWSAPDEVIDFINSGAPRCSSFIIEDDLEGNSFVPFQN